MKTRRLAVAISLILSAAMLAGCPGDSLLPLAGDASWIGTWEGNNVILGYHVSSQTTYDANGNYVRFLRVSEDDSTATWGGKWYADPERGYFDVVRTWITPHNRDMLGTTRGLYEVAGETLHSWNNPINMDRPQTRASAATYTTETRTTSKSTDDDSADMPGIAQELLHYL